MPYPNTPFYERMKREGRLLYDGKWWLHDDYRFGMTGMKPKSCSAEELARACLDARMRHSSAYQIARRCTDRRTHMKNLTSFVTYLAYNPLFRDEMSKKHGMMLGYRGLERSGAANRDTVFARTVGDPVSRLMRGPATLLRQLLAGQEARLVT
jgi:hypothetical protein